MSDSVCPACGGPLAPWRTVPAGEPSDERSYELVRCEECGSAVTPGPGPGPEMYEEGDYTSARPRFSSVIALFQRLSRRQPIRLLRGAGLAPTARVVDAGAGRGRLVTELRRAGFEAAGFDPAVRGGDETVVERATIAEHEASDLDGVVLWHVLEHLDDPLAALMRVRSWLRPGGVVLVGVPNVASLQASIAGDGWLHYDAPRHRVHLTPYGLRSLLSRAGFDTGRVRHMVWEFNPASMWMALLTHLGMSPGYPFHLLKRNAPAGARDLALLLLAGPLLLVPALALELGAAGARRGGTIAALAIRR